MNAARSVACLFLLSCLGISGLRALDNDRRISQYGHTAWRVQDGAISQTSTIAQTTDGYLWFGTTDGLMRFDGVRFVPFVPTKGQLPNRRFTSLLGAHDGSLWIGTVDGLVRMKDGQVQRYGNPSEHWGVNVVFEDHAGTIWITRYRVPKNDPGPLCQVTGTKLRCFGAADGIAAHYGLGLTEDSLGNIWFGSDVLYRWRHGSSQTYFNSVLANHSVGGGAVDVAPGPSGSVWATLDGVGPQLGVRHFDGQNWSSLMASGFDGTKVRSHALLMDKHGTLWVGTENDGFYRIHNGVADHYGVADGLSGNSVALLFEDHEDNLWVLTEGGVDMFRDTPVITYSTHQGLSDSTVRSVLALSTGPVWIGNDGAVNILKDGKVDVLSKSQGLPGQDVQALLEDHAGAVWLGVDNKLVVYADGQFHEAVLPNGHGVNGEIIAITEDVNHDIWAISSGQSHLFRVRGRVAVENITLSTSMQTASNLLADPDGGIWIATRSGTLSRYKNGHLQTSSFEDSKNPFNALEPIFGSDKSILVPTMRGLYRWSQGMWTVLGPQNGLPCSAIYSVLEDNNRALWLYARCGLLKIEAEDLARWRTRPDSRVSPAVFDSLDGAHPGLAVSAQPFASKATDGRLWFSNGILLQVINPARLFKTAIPPPVYVEGVTADHKDYSLANPLRLPAHTRDLEIDYTALSFRIPQRVRFRYKLEGRDLDWQEPGTRRQAFYSDLHPGKYRFRVIACDGNGAWNYTGATLDFSVVPAWFQTGWFQLLLVGSCLFFIWALHRLRLRQIAGVLSARFDERLAERTRMARDLHDTLLQTIEGSKFAADAALDESTDAPGMRRAMQQLSVWLGQAVQEGRAALNSLRTSTRDPADLAEALQQTVNNCSKPDTLTAGFSVDGETREIHPIVRDEVFAIGNEAIRNACMHSKAQRLAVELQYTHDLTLRIYDNGIGMEPSIASNGKEGHFGLQGMRERAARIGGKFTLVSTPKSGTEIVVVVPGSIAFQKPGV